MYVLVTSKGKVLEGGSLEKCLLRLEGIAAGANKYYRVDPVENGIIVRYNTEDVYYRVSRLGGYENGKQ